MAWWAPSTALFWGFTFKKLRGAYFALASLASLEIPRVIVDNWESLTSGSLGIVGIPRLPGLDLGAWHLPVGDSMQAQYYFLFLWMVVVALIHYRAVSSRWGWALRAIRENEIAAGVLGVNVFGYRFLALGLSAFITGVCGGFVCPFNGVDRAGHGIQPAVGSLPPGVELFRRSVLPLWDPFWAPWCSILWINWFCSPGCLKVTRPFTVW